MSVNGKDTFRVIQKQITHIESGCAFDATNVGCIKVCSLKELKECDEGPVTICFVTAISHVSCAYFISDKGRFA